MYILFGKSAIQTENPFNVTFPITLNTVYNIQQSTQGTNVRGYSQTCSAYTTSTASFYTGYCTNTGVSSSPHSALVTYIIIGT